MRDFQSLSLVEARGMQMKRAVSAASLGLMVFVALLLSACFKSETPLLTNDDGVTPLPDSFTLVQINGDGNLKLDDKGQPNVSSYIKNNKIYVKNNNTKVMLSEIDRNNNIYLLQYILPIDKSDIISYFIVKFVDNIIVTYSPPSIKKTGLDAALKGAGVTYTEAGDDFLFADKAQLLDAAHVYASRLVEGEFTRYRIASSPQDLEALRTEIAAITARAASSATVSTPTTSAHVADVKPQDPGATEVNSCDQQAAHPNDPNRLAPGVKMEELVPALALQECERAVEKYPNTARFRYQLGRAQEASKKTDAAIASFGQAAAMGDAMGWYNLGIIYENGEGVPANIKAAADYFRKAIAAGIDASSHLQEVVFTSDGYSNPIFFQNLFDGTFQNINPKSVSVYLGEFMQLFHNTSDCRDVIGTYAFSRLLQSETYGAIGQMFGALTNANRNYRPGDFGAAAQSGWDAGTNTMNGLMMQVGKARDDAQHFYDRHGCHSPVSAQFFHNIEALASNL